MDMPGAGAATTRRTIAYGAELAAPYRRQLLGGAGLLVAAVAVQDVATPLVFAATLDRIARLRAGTTGLWSHFGGLVIAYGILFVVGQALMRASAWLQWDGSLRAFTNAIHRSFERLVGLGYRWHVDHPAGEVASSLSSFAWAFIDGLDTLQWGILRVAVTVVAAVGVMAVVAWPVALVVLALSAAFAVVVVARSKPVTQATLGFSEAHSRAEGTAADVVRNVVSVLAAATEDEESDRVGALLGEVISADLKARKAFTVTRAWMGAAVGLMTWGSMLVGIVLALHGDVRTGVVYLVLFYAVQVAQQLVESFQEIRNLSRGLGRAAKLVALVDTPPGVVDRPGAAELTPAGGAVSFEHVAFAYQAGRPVLTDLHLDISAGEHVGIVGPSGGGKSTVTRLLLRLMDVDGGRIVVDGQDIAEVTQASLRRAVAYVPQDPQMLHRSIAENIWYGRPGPPDLRMVEEVGRAAHVAEFVEGLPDGYATVVGERGLKLSGGQRQRVAIAQAMLKGAPLLVLDEATSALDSTSEQLVQEALWSLMASRTALVVAHRLSTIAALDRIVVVESGRITESGTHRELLASPVGTYRRLWEHQSGGFITA